jgi:hypothetical protein
MRKTAGRKPMGEKALTSAQKMQRMRMKWTIRVEEAKSRGYAPVLVLINDRHLKACAEFDANFGNNLSNGKLDSLMFMALNSFFKKNSARKYIQESTLNALPEDSGELERIEFNSQIKFQEWEGKQ